MTSILRTIAFSLAVSSQHGDGKHAATLLQETSSGRYAWRRLSTYADLTAVIEAAKFSSNSLNIPLVLHRSHKHAIPQTLVGQTSNPKLNRFRRNLHSCTHLNPGVPTLYYDDAQVLHIIEHVFFNRLESLVKSAFVSPDTLSVLRKAWDRLTKDPVLQQPFVLKSDWFRLVITYLYGGWWLDADAVCLDPIYSTLNGQSFRQEIRSAFTRAHSPMSTQNHTETSTKIRHGCVFAWENSVQPGASANPLNWAFACSANHPLLLSALQLSAHRITQWRVDAPLLLSDPQFMARAEVVVEDESSWSFGTKRSIILVDVLHLTGPELLQTALACYASSNCTEDDKSPDPVAIARADTILRRLRSEQAGEDPGDTSTWDRVSVVVPPLEGSCTVSSGNNDLSDRINSDNGGAADSGKEDIDEGVNSGNDYSGGAVDGDNEKVDGVVGSGNDDLSADVKSDKDDRREGVDVDSGNDDFSGAINSGKDNMDEDPGHNRVCKTQNTRPVVLVLPVCFFRARGCEHMQTRFRDKVIFHHEFETSWRPSYWHNFHENSYSDGDGPVSVPSPTMVEVS